MVADLPERLIEATLNALPIDPDSDREMVARWNIVVPDAEDRAVEPNLPESYSVPVIDDAEPVAVAVVRAVLMELAKTAPRDFALQLLDVVDRLPPSPSPERSTQP